MTLEGEVHVLLNSEFFADGQAYVALSRVRRLEQLHFWALDVTRFKAARGVGAAYNGLRQRPLNLDFINTDTLCPPREQVTTLMPLAQ